MITILLPTAGRPALLRTALESVRQQTALNKVVRVIVSENAGDRASESVCAEFPSLPITYIFRTPSNPLEHAQFLMRECLHGELNAFLHDDDWWTPNHLANAIAAFEAHPDASAYGTGHFVVSGESSMLNCSGNLFPWFASNYAPYRFVWELSRLNVLVGELLGTIAHYSTLVARTEPLRKSAYVYDLGNPFDNDRMLNFALAAFGPILFNPTPEAFIRNHGVQDCFNFDNDSRIQHMCGTTRWLVENSGRPWEAVANAFFRRMAACPPEARRTLEMLAQKEWCLPEIKRHVAVKPPQGDTAAPAGPAENIAATR